MLNRNVEHVYVSKCWWFKLSVQVRIYIYIWVSKFSTRVLVNKIKSIASSETKGYINDKYQNSEEGYKKENACKQCRGKQKHNNYESTVIVYMSWWA